MAKVTIIGAHGKVAQLLTPLLVEAGHEVTGVIRNPDHAGAVEQAGATAKVADVEQLPADALAALLEGQDAVVWGAGAGGGDPQRTYAVDRDAAIRTIDAAQQAGARRFVMVSYMGARPDHGVDPDSSFFPYAEAKAAADEHLRASGLSWTIVAPGALTDEEPSGEITVTGGDRRAEQSHDTSRGNVARVVAESLGSTVAVRRMIEFCDGDQPIPVALSAFNGAV